MGGIAVAAGVGAAALAGSTVMGAISAKKAKDAQMAASRRATAAQTAQFNKAMQLMRPYVDAGSQAIDMQKAILGLSGRQQQQDVLQDVASQPELQMLIDQGEEALLQNASATGGLRGGNVQKALMEYRPKVLSELLNQRYSRLGGLANLGASAASQGAEQTQNFGQSLANQYNMQGNIATKGILGQAGAYQQGLAGVGQIAGLLAGGLGGGAAASLPASAATVNVGSVPDGMQGLQNVPMNYGLGTF